MKLIFSLLFASFAFSSNAHADFAQCPSFFKNGTIPNHPLNSPELNVKQLCFDEFAVLYAGKIKAPLLVMEKITKSKLMAAKNIERTDEFYEEARLPSGNRSTLDDFRGSGYDRGHLAPAADMSTLNGMAQSFSLANIVHQNSTHNRESWADVEKATRKFAMRAKGDVYVVTGTMFGKNVIKAGNNVWVPGYLFKAVFDEAGGRGWVYMHKNDSGYQEMKPMSIAEFTSITGVSF